MNTIKFFRLLSLLLLLLLFSSAVFAQTVISHGIYQANANSVTSAAFNQPVGTLLYVMCFSSTSTNTNTISDAAGDSFSSINSQKDTTHGSNWYNTWYSANVSAKSNNTVTCNFGSPSGNGTMEYVLISGAASSTPVDVQSAAYINDGTGQCSGAGITTVNSNDIIVSSVGNGQSGSANVSLTTTDVLLDQLSANGSPGFYGASTYSIATGQISDAPYFAYTGNGGNSICDTVSFKAAVGSGNSTLTVTEVGGGTITSSPAGINCTNSSGNCTANFPTGTSITLTETPVLGWNFTGWSGGICSGTGQQCSFTIGSSAAVTATWGLSGNPCNIVRQQYMYNVNNTAGGTSVSNPFSSNVTAGDLIVVNVFYYPSTASITISDSNGNTYRRINGPTASGGRSGEIWYAYNIKSTPNARPTITVHSSVGENALRFSATEYSGIDTSSPLDVHASNSGTGGTITSGNVTTTQSCEVATGFLISDVNNVWGAGTNWTLVDNIGVTSGQAFQERFLSTTTTLASTGQAPAGTNNWVDQIATFAAAATGLTYPLSAVPTGNGTIISSPVGISCTNLNGAITGSCSANFASNASVTLTETAGTGYTFSAWSGGNCSGSSSTCNLTMTGSVNAIATWAITTYGATQITGTFKTAGTGSFNGRIVFSLTKGGSVSSSCGGPALVWPGVQTIVYITNGSVVGTPVLYSNTAGCMTPVPYYIMRVYDQWNNLIATYNQITIPTQTSVDIGTLIY